MRTIGNRELTMELVPTFDLDALDRQRSTRRVALRAVGRNAKRAAALALSYVRAHTGRPARRPLADRLAPYAVTPERTPRLQVVAGLRKRG